MNLTQRLKATARTLLGRSSRTHRQEPIPPITAEEVNEFHRFFPRPKFFIFGHARSGTTLLMRLLRLHSEVHCDYQAHFFTRRPLLKSLVDTPEAEEWLRRKSNRWNHGKDLSPIVLRAAAEYIMEREAQRLGKRIVGDKSPSSTIHGQSVRDLFDIFPDAALVYIVRDGRDVLVSERFRNFVEESRFLGAKDRRILADLRREPDAFGEGKRSIFTEGVVRRVAGGWAANLEEVDVEGRRLFRKKYIAIRYEDLLQDPEHELRRLWTFLGVRSIPATISRRIRAEMNSNPDEEWQSRRDRDIASFLAKGRAGNWRSLLTARDKDVVKEVAGKALLRWKYERAGDW
jgi:LPS sulfotransferase NodH